MTQIEVSRDIRLMLQMWRRRSGLTQAEAASRAGIDPSWWKKLENGSRVRTQDETLALMLHAVGVTPGDLDGLYPGIRERLQVLPTWQPDAAEAHILATPGTTTAEKEALVACLRKMRGPNLPPRHTS
jgi:transcriptional regulator with XRE-family HTH domain